MRARSQMDLTLLLNRTAGNTSNLSEACLVIVYECQWGLRWDSLVAVIVHHKRAVDHQQAAVITRSFELPIAISRDLNLTAPAEHVVIDLVELVDLRHESIVILVPDLIGVLLVLDTWSPSRPVLTSNLSEPSRKITS